VKYLLFLTKSHLISSDLSGKICFWVIEGNKQQKDPVFRIHNTNLIGEESHSSSVKAIAYDKSLKILITGDDSGVIKL